MSKNKKKRGLFAGTLSRRTKRIIVAAMALVIVFGIASVVLIVLANQTKPVASTIPLTDEQKRQAVIEDTTEEADIINSAQDAMDRADSNKVDSIYQTALKDETDPTKKVKLSIDYSRVYFYAGKYDKAIQIAKTAEPLTSDKYLIANWLSQAYMVDKQYALAATYYTLTGQWAGSPNNDGRFPQAYYDQEAVSATVLAKAGK